MLSRLNVRATSSFVLSRDSNQVYQDRKIQHFLSSVAIILANIRYIISVTRTDQSAIDPQ